MGGGWAWVRDVLRRRCRFKGRVVGFLPLIADPRGSVDHCPGGQARVMLF